jgi:hypothetical protein
VAQGIRGRAPLQSGGPPANTRRADAFLPGTDAYDVAVSRNLTIGGAFSSDTHRTTALASQVDSRVWIHPDRFRARDVIAAAGTLAHEAVHNITGLLDPEIQRILLGSPGMRDDTDNISKKLASDCFGVMSPILRGA